MNGNARGDGYLRSAGFGNDVEDKRVKGRTGSDQRIDVGWKWAEKFVMRLRNVTVITNNILVSSLILTGIQ